MRLHFIGIGAQKAASTWVYRILEDHPEVAVSNPKELDFFSCHYERGYRWYEKHFEKFPDQLLRGEISPSYMHNYMTAQRIKKYNPEVKLIVTLRDPIERAYSQHLHDIRIENIQGDDLTFETGLINNPTYIEQSLYGKTLKYWLSHFELSHMHICFLEEIKKHPDREAMRLYDFLGIDSGFTSDFLNRRANESYSVKYHNIESIVKGCGKFARNYGLNRIVDVIRSNNLVKQLRDRNRVDIRMEIPPMLDETRIQLDSLFKQDREILEQCIGSDSIPW